MRPWVCAAFLMGTMLGICQAEAIRLQNGTTISADKVTEKDGQIQYTVGGTQYSIPKSSVISIDHGTPFSISIGTSKSGLIPSPAVPNSGLPSGGNHHVSHTEMAGALPPAPQLHGADSAALFPQIVSSN